MKFNFILFCLEGEVRVSYALCCVCVLWIMYVVVVIMYLLTYYSVCCVDGKIKEESRDGGEENEEKER